jgi:hypothetical protein
MQSNGTDYLATIPAQPQGQRVQYYVNVTDEEGLSIETEKVEYVVGQTPLPPYLLEAAIMIGVILFLVLIALVINKL